MNTLLLSAIGIGNIAYSFFNKSDRTYENKTIESMEKATYEYWRQLTYLQQEEYFDSNKELIRFKKDNFYLNREQTARKVAYLARVLKREFTDINNIY